MRWIILFIVYSLILYGLGFYTGRQWQINDNIKREVMNEKGEWHKDFITVEEIMAKVNKQRKREKGL